MAGDGRRLGRPAIVAVDGGNSKTDAVIVASSGRVLGAARTFTSSNVGRFERSLDVLGTLVAAATADAGLDQMHLPIAPLGVYCLAGADYPVEERTIQRGLSRRGWTDRAVVRNDTLAVLRAGTDRGWGVGLVCGAGMNCVGIAPDGRTVRFPALGMLSGDLAAGGEWLGMAAVATAMRARDGRGPRTALETLVPAYFGMAQPATLVRAVHRRDVPYIRLAELTPLVLEAAEGGDAAARRLVDTLADEIVAMVGATIRRLRVGKLDVDVVLGGGVFRSTERGFRERVSSGILAVAPRANVVAVDAPPVLGAALIGMDEIGAPASAERRLRASLTHERLEPAEV